MDKPDVNSRAVQGVLEKIRQDPAFVKKMPDEELDQTLRALGLDPTLILSAIPTYSPLGKLPITGKSERGVDSRALYIAAENPSGTASKKTETGLNIHGSQPIQQRSGTRLTRQRIGGMHHLLAGSAIRLTYLQDRRALAGIDWPAVFDDLTDAGSPRWCDLAVLTHVVLASDRSTGRYAGLLGLIERSTTLEPYLMIEAAMVRPSDAGVTLRRAMLAHALARIVCLDGKPAALAAPRGDWSIEPTLRDLGLQIRTAVLHPPVGGNVVDFNTASLARRIGTDVLLDLRLVSEASLLRDLRGLHGVRSDRSTVSAASTAAAGRPTPKLARRDTATRRPGEATHTGRTG